MVCIKEIALLPGIAVIKPDGSDVSPEFKQMGIGEADEQAAEQSVRMIDASTEDETIAITLGGKNAANTLRKCLALGMSRALHLSDENIGGFDPITVARALSQAIEDEAPSLVLCGVQSSDSAQQLTGPALATCLGWPYATAAISIEVDETSCKATVHRDVGAGSLDVIEIDLPAVITVQAGINTPRTPSFKDVLVSKKATIPLQITPSSGLSDIQLLGMRTHDVSHNKLKILTGGPAEVAKKIKALIQEI